MGCFSATEDAKCDANSTFFNFTCTSVEKICVDNGFAGNVNRTFCLSENGTAVHLGDLVNRVLATEEYFNDFMLGRSNATWENYGSLRWQLLLCLLLGWIIAYFCVVKGVESAGKAVYFTTLFPYVVLTALVVQGALLDGAVDGILLFITPHWEKFGDAQVWGMAASQTFYSYGISCGSLITLASYNKFSNNCIRDTIVVTAANGFTAIYAGFAIFSMLGFLAKQMDVPVESVATDGPGLAFVAYPEAILRLPASTFWAIIFFFMLFVLGIGSQFAGIQAVSTLVLDKKPEWRKKQWLVTLVICLGFFILGIPMCFQGGVYLLTLLEWNTAAWAIMLIGLAEVVSVSWFYGARRYLEDMASMSMKLSSFFYWFWWLCWVIITPILLVGIFVFQMVTFSLASYEDYEFPVWADWIGVLIGISTLVPLPVMAAYVFFQKKYTGSALFKPTPLWGPQNSTTESTEVLTKSEKKEEFSRF
ncbi:Sodium:neurotransmitter symporter family [Popillia japonica]|uniref:Sodium:neurotransmitter symporter family n=1 Tax=Popillia japonica TaxID=7064 RepID=A0AAW1JXG3_POPJA